VWVFRIAGLIYLGGALWQRSLSEAAWVGVGAVALGTLLAIVVDLRSRSPWATLVGLVADNALVGLVLWSLEGTAWAYWLLLIPLFNALLRSGAIGAWLGGIAGSGAVAGVSFLNTGKLASADSWTLSWIGGILILGGALGWAWQRRLQIAHDALLQRAEQAVVESEAAERRVRESYRELKYYYHRLEEQVSNLQDAAELLSALQQARDPDSLYRSILERLRARFGASGAALYVTDESGAVLRVACALGSLAPLQQTASITPIRPFQKKPSTQQIADQLRVEALGCERIENAHRTPQERADALIQPLISEGRVLGAIALSTRTANGFLPELRNRLRAIVPYLVGLIEFAEQLRLMSVRLAETQTLYNMENLIFSVNTLQSLPQQALELLKTVLPYEHAQILLGNKGETLEMAAQVGAMPDLSAVLSSLFEANRSPSCGQVLDDTHEHAALFAPAKSLMMAPLRGSARLQGIIVLGRTETPPFNELELETLQTLTFQLTNVLERAQLLSDLERLATTDGLTGLYNYRQFREHYREEINLCRRYNHPLAMMLIDLDGFKQVNDQYGHLEGDYVLVQFAEILQNALRNTELIARYGGDEFVVLMPSTNLQGSLTAAQRVVQTVRETAFHDTSGTLRLRITVSIGVAAYPDSTDNPAELLEKADEALKIAKRSGRNRAVAYEITA
jgi:diguanylate cyclase (GGDEF)-like protein